MNPSRETMNRKSIFPWQPFGVTSKSGGAPMSQTMLVDPEPPALESVELPLELVLVDDPLELVSSGTVVMGAVVLGWVVKPVDVSPPPELHASTASTSAAGFRPVATLANVSAGTRLCQGTFRSDLLAWEMIKTPPTLKSPVPWISDAVVPVADLDQRDPFGVGVARRTLEAVDEAVAGAQLPALGGERDEQLEDAARRLELGAVPDKDVLV